MISGVAGLRPNFFLQRPNCLAELAQESWLDLAAVEERTNKQLDGGAVRRRRGIVKTPGGEGRC